MDVNIESANYFTYDANGYETKFEFDSNNDHTMESISYHTFVVI